MRSLGTDIKFMCIYLKFELNKDCDLFLIVNEVVSMGEGCPQQCGDKITELLRESKSKLH